MDLKGNLYVSFYDYSPLNSNGILKISGTGSQSVDCFLPFTIKNTFRIGALLLKPVKRQLGHVHYILLTLILQTMCGGISASPNGHTNNQENICPEHHMTASQFSAFMEIIEESLTIGQKTKNTRLQIISLLKLNDN